MQNRPGSTVGTVITFDSPEPQLDQTGTIKAIEELQGFLDYFPRSDKVSIAQNAIFELQDKLTLKQLQNAQLYFITWDRTWATTMKVL